MSNNTNIYLSFKSITGCTYVIVVFLLLMNMLSNKNYDIQNKNLINKNLKNKILKNKIS